MGRTVDLLPARAAGVVLSLAFVGMALAGCMGGEETGYDGEGPNAGFVSETTGAVRGAVVDESLLPVPADVRLESGSVNETVRTDAAGSFVFADIEPGIYDVTVAADGFVAQTQTVRVNPGLVSETHFILVSYDNQPYHVSMPATGYNPCAVAFVVDSLQAGSICDPGNDRTRLFFLIPDGFVQILVETTWDQSNEEMAQWVYCCNNTETGKKSVLENAWGTPPTRTMLTAGVTKEKPPSSASIWEYGMVPEGESFELETWGYWTGPNAGLTNPTLHPVCNQFTYDRCSGAGATTGFRYDTWVTAFVRDVPDHVDRFSALPDE